MATSDCCFKGIQWDGAPVGKESILGSNPAYVTGTNSDAAILLIHDLIGWKNRNARLVADRLAEEADTTVYIPDFFNGECPDADRMMNMDMELINAWRPRLTSVHGKEQREPEMVECAKILRSKYKKVGAAGYCYGGWAVFRLGAKGRNLVDCIHTSHPAWLTKDEIDNVAVPVQISAPEHDPLYTQELKDHTHMTLPKLGIPYDYQYFPGVTHGFGTRANMNLQGEREAVLRNKNATVSWFREWLHPV